MKKVTVDPITRLEGHGKIEIFVDDDNKPYLYYPGRGISGIYVVPLDPDDLTKFAAAPKQTSENWSAARKQPRRETTSSPHALVAMHWPPAGRWRAAA